MSILSEYYHVVNDSKPEQDFNNYLFVVHPSNDNSEQQIDDIKAWEGGFHYLRKVLDQKFQKMDNLESTYREREFYQFGQKIE